MLLCLALVAVIAPPATSGHALVYSEAAGGVLSVGGDFDDETRVWLWDGSTWTVAAKDAPKRSLAGVVFNPESKGIFLFGGATPLKGQGNINWQVTGDSWGWDGKAWAQLGKGGPEPRDHHAMVYDSARKKVVMFGGGDADPTGRSVFYGDTWEWSAGKWARVATNGPIARVHHAMAYDPVRRRTVLVGGYGAKGAVETATWEWDGRAWSSMVAGGPVTRSSPRMAFDDSIGKVVLFGGETGDGLPSDTWTWDGKKWEQIAKDGPPGRTVHGLAYDAKRKVLVLFGGACPDPVDDLWEFKSGKWSKR